MPLQVLAAYLCWTASSSGVEQNFSKVERSYLERGNPKNETFRRAVIALTDSNSTSAAANTELVTAARQLYGQGAVKVVRQEKRKTRIDAGVCKAQGPTVDPAEGGTSEAAWQRHRQGELRRAIASPLRGGMTLPAEELALTAPMERECKRLKAVERKKLMEAQIDGHLLDHEKLAASSVERHLKQQRRTDRNRVAVDEGRAALWESIVKQKPRSLLNQMLMGQDVWMESPNDYIRQNLLASGVNQVLPHDALLGARIFFVHKENPQPKAQWHAVLRGGTLISDSFFQTSRALR